MKLKTVDGQEVELYGDDAKAALLAGAAPTKTDSARQWGITDADGKTYIAKSHIDAINKARQTGDTLWIPEDDTRDKVQQDGLSELKTFGKEALGAATFGLTDFARDPETARIEREENPLSAGAGQLTGTLAPLLMTGGATGIAKAGILGAKAARGAAMLEGGVGVAAKLGKAALSGAVEGAAQTAQTVVTRAISPLDDVDLNDSAISLAANVAGGALIGGALKGFGMMLPTPEKLYGDALASTVTAKLTKKAGGDMITQKEINNLGKLTRSLGLLKTDPLETERAIGGYIEKLIEKSKGITDKLALDGREVAKDTFEPLGESFMNKYASIAEKIGSKRKIRELSPADTKAVHLELHDIARAASNIISPVTGNHMTLTVSTTAQTYISLRALRQGLDRRLRDSFFIQNNPGPKSKIMGDIRNMLSSLEDDSIALIKDSLPKHKGIKNLEALNGKLSDMLKAQELARKSIRTEANSSIQGGDAAMIGAMLKAPVGAGGASILWSRVGSYLAGSTAKSRIAIADIMNTNSAIPQYLKKLSIKGGASISGALVRTTQDQEDLSVSDVHSENFYKDHLEKLNEMGRADQNPEYQKFLQGLEDMKTGLSAQVAQKTNVIAGFLNEKAPKMTGTLGLNPRSIMPSKSALDKYGQYLMAVTKPDTIFKTIENGKHLTGVQQEVLDRVFPEYKAHIVSGLQDSMSNPANAINPSAAKAGLGLTDSFGDKKAIGRLQETFVGQETMQTEPTSRPMTTSASDRSTVKMGLNQ